MSMKNPLTPAGIEPGTLATVLPRSPTSSRLGLIIFLQHPVLENRQAVLLPECERPGFTPVQKRCCTQVCTSLSVGASGTEQSDVRVLEIGTDAL